MALEQILNVWPSTLDCIKWSKDYELAIAAGEQVALLIPVLQKEPDKSRPLTNFKPKLHEEHITSGAGHWCPLFLKTNAFTDKEVPILHPTDFNTWSVGEEQSTRWVVALEWTPLPIAIHQRYALAVLTSNHVLSIWASSSTPTAVESWKRRLIINNVLASYFESADHDENVWRLRRRIRSFAWSPRLYQKLGRLRSRTQYLAVANEWNEIAILAVQTPHGILKQTSRSWKASVLFHFSLPLAEGGSTGHSSQLNHYIRDQRHASHLSWSHWNIETEQACSTLAVLANGRLILKNIKLSGFGVNPKLLLDDDLLIPDLHSSLTGPIQWVPDIFKTSVDDTHLTQMTLCAFADDEVYQLTLKSTDLLNPGIHTRDLNGNWDEISGVSFTQDPSGDVVLHYTSLSSPVSSATSNLAQSVDSGIDNEVLPWQRHILQHQALFNANYELSGKTSVKNWGINSSANGESIATCVTLHPSDQINYAIAASQYCHITVTPAGDRDQGFHFARNCHLEDFGTEAIVFSIRNWVQTSDSATEETDVRLTTDIDPAFMEIGLLRQDVEDGARENQRLHMYQILIIFWESMLTYLRAFQDAVSEGILTDTETLVEMTKEKMMADYGLREKAYRNALRFIEPLSTHELASEQDWVGVCPLETILSIPSHLYDETTVLSQRFIAAHRSASAKFKGHALSDQTYSEKCIICDSAITFEDPFEARCEGDNSHRFGT
ncbi:MAG: hypothetical protein M1821_009596 [Bathelium mastoideum]|nr:MAG: hypothetical protein M1821_009596 [Bathelium mastoideum]